MSIAEPFVAYDGESDYSTEYSLRKMTTFEYVKDRRFNCYLISIYTPTFRYVGDPRGFDWSLLTGKRILAHNALFDQLCFERMREQGIVPPDCQPIDWTCTLDMSRYFRVMGALDKAAEYLLGRTLDKAPRDKMRGKRWTDVKGTPFEKEFLAYADADAVTCYDLWAKCGKDWPESEQRISRLNRDAGIRGLRANSEMIAKDIAGLQDQIFNAEKSIPWDWSDMKTPLAHRFIREEARKVGIWAPTSFAIGNEDCDRWFLEFAEQYPWIGAVRDWRRLNMLAKKVDTFCRGMTPEGRFQFALKYFGAATGRFSGSEKFNLQNLPKYELFGVDLRGYVLPDADDMMLVSDYRQIEFRVLLHLVGDTGITDLLRQGKSPYQAHAEMTMGWDPALDLAKTDKPKYQLAKARCLALGYSCGPKKFKSMAALPQYGGLKLTAEEAASTVADFRATNPRVTAFWAARQQALVYSAIERKPLNVYLPSGRCLSYYDVSKRKNEEDRWEYQAVFVQGSKQRKRVYGGLLTENIVQATARDIMCDGWLRLADAGFNVLFTCHDEFVMSVPRKTAAESLARAEVILRTPPTWAPGLPLDVESHLWEQYQK